LEINKYGGIFVMKKLLGFLFLIMFLFPVLVFGAGSSFAILSDVTNRSGGDGHYIRTLTLKFVADDTDGSIPDLTLNASTTSIDRPLTGWCIFQVIIDTDHAGAHDGAANASVLTDTNAGWDVNQWVGYTISNATDGSTATITANTASTVTGTLSGGTQDDWDVGDTYTIAAEPTENSDLYIFQNGRDILEGNGVDKVDNTTENSVYCMVDGQPATVPIVSDLVVTVTQAATATNDAIGFIKLILY